MENGRDKKKGVGRASYVWKVLPWRISLERGVKLDTNEKRKEWKGPEIGTLTLIIDLLRPAASISATPHQKNKVDLLALTLTSQAHKGLLWPGCWGFRTRTERWGSYRTLHFFRGKLSLSVLTAVTL